MATAACARAAALGRRCCGRWPPPRTQAWRHLADDEWPPPRSFAQRHLAVDAVDDECGAGESASQCADDECEGNRGCLRELAKPSWQKAEWWQMVVVMAMLPTVVEEEDRGRPTRGPTPQKSGCVGRRGARDCVWAKAGRPLPTAAGIRHSDCTRAGITLLCRGSPRASMARCRCACQQRWSGGHVHVAKACTRRADVDSQVPPRVRSRRRTRHDFQACFPAGVALVFLRVRGRLPFLLRGQHFVVGRCVAPPFGVLAD